ncbi:MAG: hypothetical protein JWM36_1031 [Hyphomicrobiales bacterium]|nr:hypothetical protein [Hyphomicrobiales bacterium]
MKGDGGVALQHSLSPADRRPREDAQRRANESFEAKVGQGCGITLGRSPTEGSRALKFAKLTVANGDLVRGNHQRTKKRVT